MKFVIINQADRPCVRHVAQVMPCGKVARYIHHELRHWGAMQIDHATPIEDFGFAVSHSPRSGGRGGQAHFVMTQVSKAKYPDGETRQWQENNEDLRYQFTLNIWEPDRKESV